MKCEIRMKAGGGCGYGGLYYHANLKPLSPAQQGRGRTPSEQPAGSPVVKHSCARNTNKHTAVHSDTRGKTHTGDNQPTRAYPDLDVECLKQTCRRRVLVLLLHPQRQPAVYWKLQFSLSDSTGDRIPGIDAMLYLLSLYSLLGARGGPLKKKEPTYTRSKGPKCPSLWHNRPQWMNGQRGITTLGERVDSSLLKGYWSNPMGCWLMRAAKLSGVPLQCAQGCLSAAPGSAAAELKLWQDSQKPTFLTDVTTLLNSLQGGARAGWKHPPELLSGDQHLGQPLQLCSLLLHGVADPVHVCADT